MHGGLADVVAVWNRFRESFCDDLGARMLRYDAPSEDLEDPEFDLG